MGFVNFTKLSFVVSSLAQPFYQMGSIAEYVFVMLSQRKAYAVRFQKKTAGKLQLPAPNATKAELPFYDRSRMVLHVTRRLLLQPLASVLSSHVRYQILDSS